MTGVKPLEGAELARELLARELTCPVCGAVPTDRCRYGWVQAWSGTGRVVWYRENVAHIGRYDAAAAAGRVPPIPVTPGRQLLPAA